MIVGYLDLKCEYVHVLKIFLIEGGMLNYYFIYLLFALKINIKSSTAFVLQSNNYKGGKSFLSR